LIGIVFLLLICYLLSSNKRKINWRIVGSGMLLQFVFAILVLKVPIVRVLFEYISSGFVNILSYTREGTTFLWGKALLDPTQEWGYIFALQVLPTVIFFSALTSALYYLGVLQFVVKGIAWVMSKTMKLSGAESLSTAANIFLGQTEAPLLVKPFLNNMTRSELLCVMVGGMATIAGGVLAAYVGFLGGVDPVQQKLFAMHLLSASIMSAPATIVASKILLPEEEEIDQTLTVTKEKVGGNLLEAITNGITDGLKLAVNVGAMLLAFTALIYMFNGIIAWVGSVTSINDLVAEYTGGVYKSLSLQFILGIICAPIAWLLGVDFGDLLKVGQLLGEKTILNEFFAYGTLGNMKAEGVLSAKSIIIATYALCGFANFASIGIQIGGIGTLAPKQRTTLSELGFKALIGGTVASFLTACIAGMFC
jgi:CNT family concentrative nucleoside transporter